MSGKRVTIQLPPETQLKSAGKRVTIQTTPEPEGTAPKNAQTTPTTATTSNANATTTTNTTTSANNNNTDARVSNSSATRDSNCITSSQYPEDLPSVSAIGKYTNWNSQHAALAAQPWCCIGDLMAFCDKYEYKTLSLTDAKTHCNIVAEVKSLLAVGQAPFDMRKRFPGNVKNPENLWVCIGRCAGVEYHLSRILSVFRKPLEKLSTDKQRVARQNFHLAVNELRLDISARITEVRLYDQLVFEREFQLQWEDLVE